MTELNPNQQTPKKPSLPSFNQARPTFQPQMQQLTEEKIKEVIMETLIQLNLIPHVQKKKVINIE